VTELAMIAFRLWIWFAAGVAPSSDIAAVVLEL